jgi:hypothetical protein
MHLSELEEHPMTENEVLFIDSGVGGEIWNSSGHVTFKTPIDGGRRASP